MNVQELTDSMHATSVPTPLDLERVTRDGRRIRNRHRTVLAAGLAAAVVAVAVPVGLWQQPAPSDAGFASPPERSDPAFDDARERVFETDAPLGRPIGAVLRPGGQYAPKFYLGGDKVRSVGALSVWAEPDGLAFGARLVDGDGSLRRAGTLDVGTLDRRDAELARVPFQNATEPTFVGIMTVPTGTRARDLVVTARGADSALSSGVRLDVVPGRALVWVTASDGGEPGLDLRGFTVRDADGTVLARGTFEAPEAGVWEATS
jgi:hypothetical protein